MIRRYSEKSCENKKKERPKENKTSDRSGESGENAGAKQEGRQGVR